MRYWLALLLIAALPAHATDLKLSWSAPTTYADNTTPLPAGAALTYNVYGGPCGGTLALLTSTPITTTTNIRYNVNPGNWGYAVTAILAGTESAQTAPVCASVQAGPAAPGTLTVTPVTTSTIAYMLVPGADTYAPLIVGQVPLGVPCNASERLLNLNVIPRASVTFTGALKPTAVLAACN